jgi:hypothetical protein
MKALRNIPAAWVYLAQAFTTSVELLRLGWQDAKRTLKA